MYVKKHFSRRMFHFHRCEKLNFEHVKTKLTLNSLPAVGSLTLLEEFEL